MKKLLPLLISYVLMQSQCFAIDGGPDYGGNNVDTTGSYSGVIQGVTETDPSSSTGAGAPPIPGDPVPGGTTSTSNSSNALGIFDLVVNGTTTSSGAFLVFADGVVFGGSISASVDPSSDKLLGILQASYTIQETFVATGDINVSETQTTVEGTAIGSINAKISASSSHQTGARLNGSAFLDISFGALNAATNEPIVVRAITFTVSGFQTTSAINTSSTIGTEGSAGTGGQTSG